MVSSGITALEGNGRANGWPGPRRRRIGDQVGQVQRLPKIGLDLEHFGVGGTQRQHGAERAIGANVLRFRLGLTVGLVEPAEQPRAKRHIA